MAHRHYGPNDEDSNDVCSGLPVVLTKSVINASQWITDCNETLTDTNMS
jgi:hypothetical protein